MWRYCLDGKAIARIRRPDDEPPYVGMPVCMVGRTGKLAPAENFIVASVETEEKRLALEYAH